MRRVSPPLFAALFALLLLPFAVLAAEPSAGEKSPHPSSAIVKKELTEVIEAQLAAFRANDYVKAYTFAATEIKTLFPLNDFETMVKNGYPVIANSTVVEFGIALDTGEDAVVNVRVENAEKKSVSYQYLLRKEGGQWRIGGVTEVKKENLII